MDDLIPLSNLSNLLEKLFENLDDVHEEDGFYFIKTKEFVLTLHKNDELGWYVNSVGEIK